MLFPQPGDNRLFRSGYLNVLRYAYQIFFVGLSVRSLFPFLALSDVDSVSPPNLVSDEELMTLFGPGLFTVHRAWGDPFFLVVERLLGIIRESWTEL